MHLVRRSLVALALLPFVAGATSCGHRNRRPTHVSEQAVMRAFRDTSGSEPNVAVSSTRTGYVLDGDFATPLQLRRYQNLFGRFTVFVAGPKGAGTVRQMMAGTAADRDGVRWRLVRTQGQAVWVAVKRYGANVVLSWIAPGTDHMLDKRWQRLDRMLVSLTTS
jgi:hypothetical protein